MLNEIKEKKRLSETFGNLPDTSFFINLLIMLFRGQTVGGMGQLIYILIENHTFQVLFANAMFLGHQCWIRIKEFPRITSHSDRKLLLMCNSVGSLCLTVRGWYFRKLDESSKSLVHRRGNDSYRDISIA